MAEQNDLESSFGKTGTSRNQFVQFHKYSSKSTDHGVYLDIAIDVLDWSLPPSSILEIKSLPGIFKMTVDIFLFLLMSRVY
jgi:hypothetical protein